MRFKGLRVRGGIVPFLDGFLWHPRLVSPHLAPCEAQVMTIQELVTQPLHLWMTARVWWRITSYWRWTCCVERGRSRGVNPEQKSHLLAAGRWSTYGANIDRQVHWFIIASAWRKNKLVTGKGNYLSERTALSGVELRPPNISSKWKTDGNGRQKH